MTDITLRVIRANCPEWSTICAYPFNVVRNTRYTLFTFLPLNLYQQSTQSMNRYFILIAILQLFPALTPVNPITTWVPLLVIFFISGLKDAIDDVGRYRADLAANKRKVKRMVSANHSVTAYDDDHEPSSNQSILIPSPRSVRSNNLHLSDDQSMEIVQSCDIRCGDILFIESGDEIAADCVLLKSSQESGEVFIETASLDGETSLKQRQSLAVTQSIDSNVFGSLQCAIECAQPNKEIYSFDSTLSLRGEKHALSVNQFLYQATRLHGCEAWAMVVYTGNQTKVGQNQSAPRHKTSALDAKVDRTIVILFAFQISLIVIWGLIGSLEQLRDSSRMIWYLQHELKLAWYDPIVIPLRFLLLASMMIPISLRVTLDLIRLSYSVFIQWDIHMYDETVDQPAVARNSSIAEDLGQIQCLLTDKTGTLTENLMQMRAVATQSMSYTISDANEMKPDTVNDHSTTGRSRPHINTNDVAQSLQNDETSTLLRMMAGCNTVSVTRPRAVSSLQGHMQTGNNAAHASDDDSSQKPELVYSAASPDELCLVEFAASQSFTLLASTKSRIEIGVGHNLDERDVYTVLATCQFTSVRKRQSVIVRDRDGQIWLWCKGADDVIMSRLADTQSTPTRFRDLLNSFASDGLRTLCFARRPVAIAEFDSWKTAFDRACLSVSDRETSLNKVYELIEHDFELVGVTGIEDKLQPEVTQTIEALREAGIKVWCLTGDKQETAVEIAVNCGLVKRGDPLFYVQASSLYDLEMHLDSINESINESIDRSGSNYSLVVDGTTLALCLHETMCDRFYHLASSAASVVCCRVTPNQKALIVKLVAGRGLLTCAIGDGANDCAMIREASIGCAIIGREGREASRAADFSFTRFSHLQRLLFVHGRYSFTRTALVAQYCFYKSMVICLIQLYFAMVSQFSGSSFFDSLSITSYNLVYTSVLAFFMLFERDVEPDVLVEYPALYRTISRVNKQPTNQSNYTRYTLLAWFGRAVYQSIIIVILSFNSSAAFSVNPALASCQRADALTAYTVVVLVQCFTLYLEQRAITILTHIVVIGMVFTFFIINSFISVLRHSEASNVFLVIVSDPLYWCNITLCLGVCLFPVIGVKAWLRNWYPDWVDEANQLEQDQKRDDVQMSVTHRPPLFLSSLGRPFYDTLGGENLDDLSPSSRPRDHAGHLSHSSSSSFSYSVSPSPSPSSRSPDSPKRLQREHSRKPRRKQSAHHDKMQSMPLVNDVVELDTMPIVREITELSLTDWLASSDILHEPFDPSLQV